MDSSPHSSSALPAAGQFVVHRGWELRVVESAPRDGLIHVRDGDSITTLPQAQVERRFYRKVTATVQGVEVVVHGVHEARPHLAEVWYEGGDIILGAALGLMQEKYNIWMGALPISDLRDVTAVEVDQPFDDESPK
jgi:hypothetical protein